MYNDDAYNEIASDCYENQEKNLRHGQYEIIILISESKEYTPLFHKNKKSWRIHLNILTTLMV